MGWLAMLGARPGAEDVLLASQKADPSPPACLASFCTPARPPAPAQLYPTVAPPFPCDSLLLPHHTTLSLAQTLGTSASRGCPPSLAAPSGLGARLTNQPSPLMAWAWAAMGRCMSQTTQCGGWSSLCPGECRAGMEP